ncbi:MAG TPA: mechanosensitive ion channel domain-containing protein [Bacillaceae bacterium]
MQENRVLESLSFFKRLSINEILLFIVYLSLIFLVKWAFLFALKRWIRTKWFQERAFPVVEDVLRWIAFYGSILFFLLYFSKENWLFTPIYKLEGVEVSLFLIIVAVMIVTFASRLVKAFNAYVMPFFYEQLDVDVGMGYTINRLIYYTVMLLALAISFAIVGLDLRALAVVFSALGIGIGFGLRNVAANFVSGIIILFERPLEVGETVEVEGKIGRISRIKLRSTVIETFKEGTMIVPNQYFIEHIVKNRTGSKVLAQVKVSVAYGSDTEKVESLLHQAVKREATDAPGVMALPEPDIRFVGFRNSALDFLLEIPVLDVPTKEHIESRLRHAISDLFYNHGIKLAEFPIENVKE